MLFPGADTDVGARILSWHMRRARHRREEGGGITCIPPAYHLVLAVNRRATGFRGINGRLPAKRGSPPFIPRPIALQLTAAREVMGRARAIPPKMNRGSDHEYDL